MKIFNLLRVLFVGGIACAAVPASATVLDFANVKGAILRIDGSTDSFEFLNNTTTGTSFRIALSDGVGDAVGLEGRIVGTFQIGPVTVNGSVQTAPVTSSPGAMVVINDGVTPFSGYIDWIGIRSQGTAENLNMVGDVNLTGITYSGTRADLRALASGNDATAVVAFTFNPAKPLTTLTQDGLISQTTFTGDLIGIAEGTVGNFVWHDLNANGIQEPGEPGIAGVTLSLTDSVFGVVQSVTPTITDVNGLYLYTGLYNDGFTEYTVDIIPPIGYLASPTLAGSPASDSNPSPTTTILTATAPHDLTLDFGFYMPAQLGDFVWNDVNADGIQDAGEPPIPGVMVSLYDCNHNLLSTMATDANGLYLFTGLTPGSYYVEFGAVSGFVRSPQDQGGDDAKDSDANPDGKTTCVTLGSGETNLTVDAGYYQPAQLGDFVWHDLNANGVQDAGEPGVPDVRVTLYACGGAVKDVTLTGPDGKYLFNTEPGDYYVLFELPAGYAFSPLDQGGNDATDSDADESTGKTICTTLTSGESDLTWDAGIFAPCQLVVTKECLIPPPPPAGFNCSDAKPIDSLTLVWGGSQAIGIKAWKGAVGSTLLAMIDGIAPGQTVTVSGFAGSPNDVYYEIFAGTTAGAKLGESTFHLSCSDADMNGPEDCGKWAGDGKARTGFINEWIFEGIAGNGFALGCTAALPTPSPTCTVMEAPFASCETLGKPTSLTFRYTGGGCGAGNNPQGGKFTCAGAIDPALPVTIVSANGYAVSPATVLPGEDFTVSASSFLAQSTFTLSNAGGTETISLHTSCSQPLAVGDVFASLTLVGFNGQMGGSSVIYRYTVKNDGPLPLNGVMLTDDQLGPIAGPFNLLAGEIKTFDQPVQISDSVVNVATATVEGTTCSASSGPVEVTVLRNCPVPAPSSSAFDCSSIKPIDSLTMIWAGSQTIGVKAWKGAVGTSVLLASLDNIAPGSSVTVSGYAGAPNDVYWEIFDGTTAGAKLGTSTFHLSCSDEDMNGPEDCGKLQGDGKAKAGYINQWVFEAMAGNGKSISCTAPPTPLPTATINGKKLEWPLSNIGSSKLTMTGMTLTWPAANKKLVKVKFDRDVIWDAGSPAGATSITLNISDLTNDLKKKSIDPGKTRKFTLEFEADASTNLSDYDLEISFGKCTLSLW